MDCIGQTVTILSFVVQILMIPNHVWRWCKKHISYLCNLKENLDSLTVAMQELKNERAEVQRRVEFAEAQSVVRRPQVQDWLQRVEVAESQVNELLQQGFRQNEERCLRGCCLKNWWASYTLGKKVVKKLANVNELMNKAKFDEVVESSHPALVQGMPESPTVGMEPLLEKAMKLLEDDQVGVLGIYGMGGVGKTTLLNKINNEFLRRSSDLDVVISMVVSKELNLGRIQKELGKRLGLSWEGNELSEDQAKVIFNILSHKKYVVLLDDCWQRVDLKQVGIPHPKATNKCKVVFTTRSEVVCGLMEAKKKIKVECLQPAEAWDLFEEKVGEDALSSDPDIPKLARVVANECHGLPLALITVGRAMASKKTAQEWTHAITMLRKFTSEFPGMEQVFSPLKLSYDNLHDDTIKSCFLYCSLFTEDCSIDKELLINHWIGEGFVDEFGSIDEAYNRGHDIIGSLKAVSLLESGYDDLTQVKMHDVIRDLAIWIGCECGTKKDKLLIRTGAYFTEAPQAEKWKDAERISLMDNHICSLTDAPTAPNLLTLLLQDNWVMFNISNNFFQFMPALKVLNLSNAGITHLPTSITHLVQLQYLDLSRTDILELPSDLKNLVNLKFLELSFTESLRIIPHGAISSLSNLQMLDLYGSNYHKWETEDFDYNVEQDGGMTLMKLEHLEHVKALGLTVKSTTALQMLLNNNKLWLTTLYLWIDKCQDLVSLNLMPSYVAPSASNITTIYLGDIKNLQVLMITACDTLEELTISWEGMDEEIWLPSSLEILRFYDVSRMNIIWKKGFTHLYFPKLCLIHIHGCHVLKDFMWLLFAPNLKELLVSDCKEVETILKGIEVTNQRTAPFSRLKKLRLSNLPKLQYICEHSLPFPSLQLISVTDCPRLEKLPLDSNSAQNSLQFIVGSVEWWNKLQWKDQNLKSSFLPYFTQFGVLNWQPIIQAFAKNLFNWLGNDEETASCA